MQRDRGAHPRADRHVACRRATSTRASAVAHAAAPRWSKAAKPTAARAGARTARSGCRRSTAGSRCRVSRCANCCSAACCCGRCRSTAPAHRLPHGDRRADRSRSRRAATRSAARRGRLRARPERVAGARRPTASRSDATLASIPIDLRRWAGHVSSAMAQDSLRSFGVVLVAAAAGSFGGSWFAGACAGPVMAPPTTAVANAMDGGAAAAAPDLLPRLLQELVALRASLPALREARDPATPHDRGTSAAFAGTPVPFVLDEDALLQALLRIEEHREQARVDAMSDKELFHDADVAHHHHRRQRSRRPRSVAYRLSEVAAIYPITPSSTMGELRRRMGGEGQAERVRHRADDRRDAESKGAPPAPCTGRCRPVRWR
jgi:hypothetical protein